MPLSYSKSPAGLPYDLHPDADEDRFREGLSAFYSGQPIPTVEWIELGPTAEQIAERDDPILRQLDEMVLDTSVSDEMVSGELVLHELVLNTPITAQAPVEDDEPAWEIIEDEPVLTHYDRAREAVREAEAERESSEPGTGAHCTATARLAEAKGKLKTEIERDGDDGWRKRRRIDKHRAGAGREDYNAGRRKVRTEPNARLTDMTAEERAEHERALDSDRKWVARQRKAGWTEERIAAGLEERRAKRLTKGQWTV